MSLIIDFHSHLGDILSPNGGQVIGQSGIRKRTGLDLIALWQLTLNRDNFGTTRLFYRVFNRWVVAAEQARSGSATLINIDRSMKESGIDRTVCLPIFPYVTFQDLNRYAAQDRRIIPFTTIDFSDMHKMEERLKNDLLAGARGVKLHPIIQKVPLNDRRTFEAVEAIVPLELPVLFHCGINSYYPVGMKQMEDPRLGSIDDARELVSSFPKARFIAGHAGMFQVKQVMAGLSGFKNVSVDTSFQSPRRISQLLETFGPERVLFASDWPFGSRRRAVQAAKSACRKDESAQRLLFYENASRLLARSGNPGK